MTKRSTLVVAFLSMALAHQGMAQEQGCDPKPDAAKLANLVSPRDSVGLSEHLLDTANLSRDFLEANGVDSVKGAIDELVSRYFSRSSAGSPPDAESLSALANDFREGILAACKEKQKGSSDKKVAKKAIQAANLTGGDSKFALLLGTAHSLEGDGNFSTGLEASFQSTTDFMVGDLPFFKKRWPDSRRIVTGTFEVTFSEIGSIDDEDDMSMGSEPAEPNRNPFAAGGGFFRLNTSADIYFSESTASGLGFRIGGGFSTQPSDSADSDVDTRERGYAGLVFRANYGKDEHGRDGKGEVFLGYAKDRFWKFDRVVDDSVMPAVMETVNETERLIVDARMDIPKVFESDDVRLHARLFADLPASGDGPSDIRISLLLTVNLGAIFPVN